jgi:hypothetical protein
MDRHQIPPSATIDASSALMDLFKYDYQFLRRIARGDYTGCAGVTHPVVHNGHMHALFGKVDGVNGYFLLGGDHRFHVKIFVDKVRTIGCNYVQFTLASGNS